MNSSKKSLLSNCFTTILIVTFCLTVNSVNAQRISFEQVKPVAPMPTNEAEFDGINFGKVVFADVDGDNDEDALITGRNQANLPIAKLYKNDGLGNFTLVIGTPFPGVYQSALAFGDIDGDNDLDLLMSGYTGVSPITITTNLFLNDGSGNFTLDSLAPFDSLAAGSISFGDVDGDADLDVVLTGGTYNNLELASLYKNDGSGNFTLANGTPFIGVLLSSTLFFDVDGDSDLDLFISGSMGNTLATSDLFLNDGTGAFTLDSSNSFVNLDATAVDVGDIDNDNDLDLIYCGFDNSAQEITAIYINDSTGNFTRQSTTSVDSVARADLALHDFNGDGYLDLLISGVNSSTNALETKLFINDSIGGFGVQRVLNEDGYREAALAVADVDGVNGPDILLGGTIVGKETTHLYMNDGNANFSIASGTPFFAVSYSASKFVDIDGDTDLDIVISGRLENLQRNTSIYRNDGTGAYTFDSLASAQLTGMRSGAIDFGDVDNDGDSDMLMTGLTQNFGIRTILYKNDSTGSFTQTGTPFEHLAFSAGQFVDFDNDNDLDVIVCGRNGSTQKSTRLYRNNGSGSYSLYGGSNIERVQDGAVAFADVDNDNDLDLFISGENFFSAEVSRLYLNNGSGVFTLKTGTPFVGVKKGGAAFADVDGDGDKDLLVNGENSSGDATANLYLNDSTGNYSIDTTAGIAATKEGSLAFADFDGDLDLDIIICGINTSNVATTILYVNDSVGNFSPVDADSLPFEGVSLSAISIDDMNGDNLPDILISGLNNENKLVTKLYKNTMGLFTSIPQYSSDQPNFLVFPNPSKGHFTLRFNQLKNESLLWVYDMNGRKIEERLVNTLEQKLDLSSYGKGMYLIRYDNQLKKVIVH